MKTILGTAALFIATANAALAGPQAQQLVGGLPIESLQPAVAAAVASLDGGGQATPLAACQNVTIRVNNQKSRKIKALKIDYRSVQDGHTRTEQFSNTEVPANTTKNVATGQSLQHVEGHNMSWIKLYYKAWCGGKWSVTKTYRDSSFDNDQCVYGKTYRIDLPSTNPC